MPGRSGSWPAGAKFRPFDIFDAPAWLAPAFLAVKLFLAIQLAIKLIKLAIKLIKLAIKLIKLAIKLIQLD